MSGNTHQPTIWSLPLPPSFTLLPFCYFSLFNWNCCFYKIEYLNYQVIDQVLPFSIVWSLLLLLLSTLLWYYYICYYYYHGWYFTNNCFNNKLTVLDIAIMIITFIMTVIISTITVSIIKIKIHDCLIIYMVLNVLSKVGEGILCF